MSILRDYAARVSQPTLPFGAPAESTRFDEVIASDGALRPAWKSLPAHALALTPEDLRRIDGEIARFLADDGVSYNRPDQGAVPWQLDPMPMVIEAETWATLETGIAQRAELLNAILADLYGPQELLRAGVLPAAVVVGHSGFLRPLARSVAADPALMLLATDLGRDADGQWHALADRVQAPSGLGFTAENRRVLSQVLPDLYQESGLHRLDPYFAALRAAIFSAAPSDIDEPQTVILSPGSRSETAFDQAFLASSMGFPMVQGGDLVVRNGRVWMKPPGWPRTKPTERVDVIIRRVDAEYCDPLELRADSQLGVAGLSEVVRRGGVTVVNGLGAGVLENPGLMPFLPAIAEHLLGEQLRLPSSPTWWCGADDDREFVLTRLEAGDTSLVIRPIDQTHKHLSDLAPEELAHRVRAEPHRYVGQEQLLLSQTPTWTAEGTVAAMPMIFRSFALKFGASYRPLAGGLATVRRDRGSAPRTKDVWVLKAAASDPDQNLAEISPVPSPLTIVPLAPRALAALFWLGRYAERAEDLLRLLVTTQAQFDEIGPAAIRQDHGAMLMLQALRSLAGFTSEDLDAEFRSILLDDTRAGSAANAVQHLRTTTEAVRDQLSGDTWRVFSNIDRAARALRSSPHAHRTAESAGRMLTALLSLYGVTENMIRDTGWHMIKIGRYLERGLQLSHLLRSVLAQSRDARCEREVLGSLLHASESVVTYRRRYRGVMRTAEVLELLLLDATNPRSLLFALERLSEHLAVLPASTGSSRPERLLEELQSEVATAEVRVLGAVEAGRRGTLEAFLSSVVVQLEQLSDAISHHHFESGPPPVPMADILRDVFEESLA